MYMHCISSLHHKRTSDEHFLKYGNIRSIEVIVDIPSPVEMVGEGIPRYFNGKEGITVSQQPLYGINIDIFARQDWAKVMGKK